MDVDTQARMKETIRRTVEEDFKRFGKVANVVGLSANDSDEAAAMLTLSAAIMTAAVTLGDILTESRIEVRR